MSLVRIQIYLSRRYRACGLVRRLSRFHKQIITILSKGEFDKWQCCTNHLIFISFSVVQVSPCKNFFIITAHVWGWRSPLVEVDFTFLFVIREVQVLLNFYIFHSFKINLCFFSFIKIANWTHSWISVIMNLLNDNNDDVGQQT